MRQVLDAGGASILPFPKPTALDAMDPTSTIILASPNQTTIQSDAAIKKWIKRDGGVVLSTSLILDLVSQECAPKAVDYLLAGGEEGAVLKSIQKGLDGLWLGMDGVLGSDGSSSSTTGKVAAAGGKRRCRR